MAHRPRTTSVMTAPVASRAMLPADRAFVVQLRADADLGRGLISGRLEHMTSGFTALFESVEELVDRMQAAVVRREGPRQ